MEDILKKIYSELNSKYYGKYRGLVVDRDDPEKKGRLKLQVPSVLGEEETDWALPCTPFGGSAELGFFAIPEVGAHLWVEFEAGDISHPIWIGSFWGAGETPPSEAIEEDTPHKTVLKTLTGACLELSGKADEDAVTLSTARGNKLQLLPDGSSLLTDECGNEVSLQSSDESISIRDCNGNTVLLNSSGIEIKDATGSVIELQDGNVTVKSAVSLSLEGTTIDLAGAGGESLIKGNSFLALYAAHTHPTPTGPSGPPVPAGEMATLSQIVKTK